MLVRLLEKLTTAKWLGEPVLLRIIHANNNYQWFPNTELVTLRCANPPRIIRCVS